MLELDGSMGEGGGQILRTSLALSLLTGQSFRLRNIRAGRAKPGLQPQHRMSVRAAATIGQAEVHGDALGSKELVFEPGPVTPGKYEFHIGTAGATGLVLHTIYLPLAWNASGPSELTLTGGTHVKASPCFHFLDMTWRPYMELLGLNVKLRMLRPGFYPRGGGVVNVYVQPGRELQPLRIEQAIQATNVTVLSAAAGLPEHVTQRQARQATSRLRAERLNVDVQEEKWTAGPGTMLGLVLDTHPVPTLFFGLGERGKPAERVADEAVDQVIAYLASGQGVDPHSADQLVLPLALAQGASTLRVAEVTSHLLTNISVIRRFLDRVIDCAGGAGGPGTVRIL